MRVGGIVVTGHATGAAEAPHVRLVTKTGEENWSQLASLLVG